MPLPLEAQRSQADDEVNRLRPRRRRPESLAQRREMRPLAFAVVGVDLDGDAGRALGGVQRLVRPRVDLVGQRAAIGMVGGKRSRRARFDANLLGAGRMGRSVSGVAGCKDRMDMHFRSSPGNLQALIFDVDGTLADTEEAHRLAFNDAFAEQGLPWRWGRERYAVLLKTTGGKERLGTYIDTLDLAPERRDELRARIPELHRCKTAHYTRRIRAGAVPLRAGVRRLVAEARAAGLRLAIASTTTSENIEALLATTLGADAPGWFAVIAAGDDAPRKKPAPDIYEIALSRLSLGPDGAVAFEDSALGVAAAKAAGLFTVATPNRWTRGDDLRAADLVLPSLGDADQPLTGRAAARVGGPMLDLAALARCIALAPSGRRES